MKKTLSQRLLESRYDAFRDFIRTLEAVEPGELYAAENFATILTNAFELGFKPQKLAETQDVSPAAVSKWKGGTNIPAMPTRRTVINWLIITGNDRLEQEAAARYRKAA